MRTLFIATITAVVFAVFPAGAEPIPTPPCATSAEYGAVGLSGKNESFAPAAVPSAGTDLDENVEAVTGQDVPSVPYHPQSTNVFRYRVDLSGSPTVPAAQSATVTLNLTWDNDSDFDLYVYDAAGTPFEANNGFNPLDGSGESLVLTGVKQCTDLRIDVVNYAGLPTSAMGLKTTVTKLK